MSGSIVRRVFVVFGVLTVGTVGLGLGAPVAHAVTLPAFPAGPVQIEVPAGTGATTFIPMPGMCADGGVFHGQMGKPVFDGPTHGVSHMGFRDLCTADAGLEVGVKFEEAITGIVSVTIVTIDGRDDPDGDVVAAIGPFTIEFYMGVEIPEPIPQTGGEAGPLSVAALAAVLLGAVLLVGSRRRRLV